MTRSRFNWLIVTTLCAIAFFAGLGRAPVGRIQEARVLETAREMLKSGDFILPRMNAEPRLQKAPLAYWLAAGGYSVGGHAGEAEGRFYSAAAGTLGALLLLAYGSFMGRRQAGFWAALILVTSRLWLRHSRLAETDVLLSLTIAGALLALFVAFDQPGGARRLMWLFIGWAGMAAAVLAKGPAVVSLPLLTALVCAVAHRGRSGLRVLFHPFACLLFLALVTPWFLLVTLREEMAPGVFWHELAVTASGASHGHDLPYSLFYYLLRVWPDFGPWSLLLPFVVSAAVRAFRSDSFVRFSVLWIIAMLCQLEVVGSRQPHYLLPVLPGLALLTGWWLAERAQPVWRRLAACVIPLPVAVALFLAFGGDRLVQPEHFARRDFALAIDPLVRGRPLWIYGRADPILCFYLKRTIPEATIGDLRDRLGSEGSLLVLMTVDFRAPEATIEEAIPGVRQELLAGQKLKPHESVFLYRLTKEQPRKAIRATGHPRLQG
ncbi:MAG: ArnT family glycosyltransferase [Acidobacteriota bacterium]